ncbi:MAG TPA: hypothetical protein VN937_12085 [Blastocatellia bacterium]|nr:hypothetical protein [Blastocatellia bacterium]
MRAKQSELLTTTHGKSAACILARTNIYCQATRNKHPIIGDTVQYDRSRAIGFVSIRAANRRSSSRLSLADFLYNCRDWRL